MSDETNTLVVCYDECGGATFVIPDKTITEELRSLFDTVDEVDYNDLKEPHVMEFGRWLLTLLCWGIQEGSGAALELSRTWLETGFFDKLQAPNTYDYYVNFIKDTLNNLNPKMYLNDKPITISHVYYFSTCYIS